MSDTPTKITNTTKESNFQLYTLILAFLLFIFLSLHYSFFATHSPKVDSDVNLMPKPLSKENIHDWGDSKLTSTNSGNFQVYINYPVVGIPKIDKVIKEYVDSEYKTAEKIFQSDKENQNIEVNIQYSSYFTESKNGTKYGSIIFNKMVNMDENAHPENSVQVFNVNITQEKFLAESEIIDFSQINPIINAIKEKLNQHNQYKNFTNEVTPGILDKLIITQKYLGVIADSNSIFPTYLGVVEIPLSYYDVHKYLKIDNLSYRDSGGDSIDSDSEQYTEVTISKVKKPKYAPTDKLIALTFDDGPGQYLTDILKLLKKNKSFATFYMIGDQIEGHEEGLRKVILDGHEIGGHSMDHLNLVKLNDADITYQLKNTNELIWRATGVLPTTFRPPYGNENKQVEEVAKNQNLAIINWSIDTEDWKSRNSDAVYREIMKQIKPGAIILCHEIYKSSVDAVSMAIPELIRQGYKLVTVSDLIGKTEPGKVYYNK